MNYEDKKRRSVIINAINELIELGYITKNEHVSLDGIAGILEGNFFRSEQEDKKRKEIGLMFEVMEKYFNEQFQEWIKKMGEKSK